MTVGRGRGVDPGEFSGRYSLVAKHVRGIAEARTASCTSPAGVFPNGLITDLQRVLGANRSREGYPVCIDYQGTGAGYACGWTRPGG
ncbi:MAG: hypothetical protein ACREWG_02050 [Gammaproteobacteria bacterium]